MARRLFARPPVPWLWPGGQLPRRGHDREAVILAEGTFLVSDSRAGLTRAVAEWALTLCPGFDAEAVVLLVSEVVTNAIRHSGSEQFSLVIALFRDRLSVAVTDERRSACCPQVKNGGPIGAEGGMGLQIVNGVARAWGVAVGPRRQTVWFEVGQGRFGAATDAATSSGGEAEAEPVPVPVPVLTGV